MQAFNHLDKGDTFDVDVTVASADVADYAALVLPGGVANPDTLRTDEDAVAFVRQFVQSGKPVAAICHAPWTLIEADVVRGRHVTSWPSLQTDLRNAGADLGGPRGRRRRQPHHEPQPRRHPGLHARADRRAVVVGRPPDARSAGDAAPAARAQAWAGVAASADRPREARMTSTKRTMMSLSPKSFGREHLRHAQRLEPHGIRLGDDAADDHRHVAGAGRAQSVEHLGHQLHVRPGQDRDADEVNVLGDRGRDDLLGRQPDALVDDLEAGVAGAHGDLLGAVGVPVEARLADEQPQPLAELLARARPPSRAPRRAPRSRRRRRPSR